MMMSLTPSRGPVAASRSDLREGQELGGFTVVQGTLQEQSEKDTHGQARDQDQSQGRASLREYCRDFRSRPAKDNLKYLLRHWSYKAIVALLVLTLALYGVLLFGNLPVSLR